MAKRLTVIDCDPGTDDAAALFMLAKNKAFPDLAIATFGNAPQALTAENLAIMCALLGVETVRANGATKPLEGPHPTCGTFHGVDALAGLHDAWHAAGKPCPAGRALAEAWRGLAGAAGIDYIAVGPLTTLATILSDPAYACARPSRAFIMGGGLAEFNQEHDSEYNFHGDPTAARRVFASDLDLTLFPLDITHHHACLTKAEIDTLAATGKYPEMITLFRNSLDSNVACGTTRDAAVLHDVLPALYAMDPSGFTVVDRRLSVDRWGRTFEEESGRLVHVAVALKPGYFYQKFKECF